MDFLTSLLNSMPGAAAQGLIWGIMAIGVYLTYRILDVADLTVDGSLGTGGAVCVVLVLNGAPVGAALVAATLAGMLAGLVTGLFHTACGIPAILAGILTQLALYSVNLRIMGTGTAGEARPTCPSAWTSTVCWFRPGMSVRWHSTIRLSCCLSSARSSSACCTGSSAQSLAAPARDRCQPAHGSCAGHQHQCGHRSGLMISNGLVALAGGLLAQYQASLTSTWARCHRHRSGGGHHR